MSAEDLDAELLGMVGGESDDEGEEADQTQAFVEARSPTPEARETVEKAEEPARRTKGVAQKVKGRRKKARKQESEDEDDLGGDSPSPEASLGSGGMHDSDGEIDAPGSPEDEETPLYPLDNKYRSAQDREDILALPELERESILAERAAEQLKRTQDLQLKRALAAAQTANKNKRKAAAAELDDGGRRTRPKAEKTHTALDDYKRARELKGTDRGRQEAGRGRRDERSPSAAGSDRDADGESEVEWAEPSSDRRGHDRDRDREEVRAELRDFDRCRVGRTGFAKMCFYPGFEDAIVGCFARVSIGPDRHTGQNMYRMAQIKRFTEGKPYQLEHSTGKRFQTDNYAVVAQGAAERPWPFSACSDGRITDQEFDRYMATLKKENVRVPSRKYLEARLDAIHGLLNINWTDEMIGKKLANQRTMEKKFDPANQARVKREKIHKRKLEAEESGDADEVVRCDAELAALENNAQNSSTTNNHAVNGAGIKASPAKKPPTNINSAQEHLAKLNMKNRGKNVQEIRKALLEEKRKLALSRGTAAAEAKAKITAELAKQEAEAATAAKKLLSVPGKEEMSDLFGDSDVSRSVTPVPQGSTPKRSRAGTPSAGTLGSGGGGGGGGGGGTGVEEGEECACAWGDPEEGVG
ncbi:RNA polymerase-associated protein rtf1 [Recurvomyces mirabilis]|uniref:RNA polymerase-associated protein rtf1 n=1 Tax=Recurvomyces mirabilis TaxID=574656 RepID=A0AAE1C5N1_9PEZI|nr:RNA polymerase-associated protein rtf1 [Recurvomyces mirabilis]KAK5161451.1 RNA polymerase-associated protein rtf1 [Recurvomyces mirabilis]